MPSKNMVHAVKDRLVLLIHNVAPPSDDEWFEYVRTLTEMLKTGGIKQIVFTDGGSPNTTQRGLLNQAVKDKDNQVAVVSDSPMVRSVVTALAWFNPKVKVFAPTRIDEALAYLGYQREEMPRLLTEVRALRLRLGNENLRSIPQTL